MENTEYKQFLIEYQEDLIRFAWYMNSKKRETCLSDEEIFDEYIKYNT